tara:strand:+ start:620 stop:1579 length:960 start_codon:yes stop_codon:yes gene_type:complete
MARTNKKTLVKDSRNNDSLVKEEVVTEVIVNKKLDNELNNMLDVVKGDDTDKVELTLTESDQALKDVLDAVFKAAVKTDIKYKKSVDADITKIVPAILAVMGNSTRALEEWTLDGIRDHCKALHGKSNVLTYGQKQRLNRASKQAHMVFANYKPKPLHKTAEQVTGKPLKMGTVKGSTGIEDGTQIQMLEDGSVIIPQNVYDPVVEQIGSDKKTSKGLNNNNAPMILTEEATNRLYSEWFPSEKKKKGPDGKDGETVKVSPIDALKIVSNAILKGKGGKGFNAELETMIKSWHNEMGHVTDSGTINIDSVTAWFNQDAE